MGSAELEKGDISHVARGKRTYRHRLHLADTGVEDLFGHHSPTTSDQFSGSVTEEEEDMANCLIMLAQGSGKRGYSEFSSAEKLVSRGIVDRTTTGSGKAGVCVYECKTCYRCFPSFQALGGHRASHKKPKPAEEMETQSNCPLLQLGKEGSSSDKPRVHECSICGTEFSSGQALGGHMRRHRPTTADSDPKKQRSDLFSLDLNLPAPTEEDRDPPAEPANFSLNTNSHILLSRSSLVPCHY